MSLSVSELLVWPLIVVLFAVVDKLIIASGRKPNYLQSFIVRGIVTIVYGACIEVGTQWFVVVPLLFYVVCSFYAIFGPLLNALRGLPWYYLGEDSGWLDPFFIDHRWLWYIVYFGSVVVSVITFIILVRI